MLQDTSSLRGESTTHQMPMKFSGKVSGILDDLSDAMSLLRDLLPSAASDIHLQVGNTDPKHDKGPETPMQSSGCLSHGHSARCKDLCADALLPACLELCDQR